LPLLLDRLVEHVDRYFLPIETQRFFLVEALFSVCSSCSFPLSLPSRPFSLSYLRMPCPPLRPFLDPFVDFFFPPAAQNPSAQGIVGPHKCFRPLFPVWAFPCSAMRFPFCPWSFSCLGKPRPCMEGLSGCQWEASLVAFFPSRVFLFFQGVVHSVFPAPSPLPPQQGEGTTLPVFPGSDSGTPFSSFFRSVVLTPRLSSLAWFSPYQQRIQAFFPLVFSSAISSLASDVGRFDRSFFSTF